MSWRIFAMVIMITVTCGITVSAESSEIVYIYVAANGNDSWSGSMSKPDQSGIDGPFATLQRAKDKVREMKKAGISDLICIEIGSGIYQMSKPLEFSAEDSGASNSPVEYRAKSTGKVRLVGGRVVTGFTLVEDAATLSRLDPSARGKVYQDDLKANGISDFQTINNAGTYQSDPGLELFFNDKPMTLARYPNSGYMKIDGVFDANGIVESGQAANSDGRFICNDPRIERWSGDKGVWMHGFWFWDWADQRIPMASVNAEKHLISLNIGQGAGYGLCKGQWFYAENILSELDSPGEWYLDRDTGIVYFWPPEPLTTGRVVVSTLRDPIRLNNASNIIFRGLTIEDGRGTAVTINGGSNVQMIGCTIRNMGNWAVKAKGGTGHKVIGCDIYTM
ncbi:MAG: right-handed parallel beta-helix repeat-containing protein, partial [Armatimonadota bacterium]